MAHLTESTVEQAALAWLEAVGWGVAHGPEIAPAMPGAERTDYGEVVLTQRLRDALTRLNPDLPTEALDDTFRKLTRPEGADLIQCNRAVYQQLVRGMEDRLPRATAVDPAGGPGARSGPTRRQAEIARRRERTVAGFCLGRAA